MVTKKDKELTILIRKGYAGYPVAACTETGAFISNFESIQQLRERWKEEKKFMRINFIKELDRWPDDMESKQTVYGYARVSTRGQASDGNSLDSQEDALKAAGATVIFKDVFTGRSMDRPQLQELLSTAKGGDTIVVTRLDRLGRSVSQASDLINDLLARRITINVLNIGILSNDSVNTLLRNVLLSFAQFERDMIVDRTQEGKAIARQRSDYKEGRPKKFAPQQIDHAMKLLEDHSYKQVEQMTGISKSTLLREKKHRSET